MIKHVVMWKMKPQAEGADGATNVGAVRAERQCFDWSSTVAA